MRVFSNTTPMIALSSIDKLDLLPALFNEIYVVEEVIKECAEGGKIIVPDLTKLYWLNLIKSVGGDSKNWHYKLGKFLSQNS